MYEGASIAVVVVAYNEEAFVGEVIDTVPSFVDRVYAVDDGSADGTWEEIRARATDTAAPGEPATEGGAHVRGPGIERDGGTDDGTAGGDAPSTAVVPVRHETNRGVGAAIKTGYREAVADGIDVTVVMAGDGQMDPDQMDRLVAPVATGRAGFAKGDRLSDPGDRGRMSTFRYAGNVLLTGLTRIASGYWGLSDPQNGYTAISRQALEAIDLDALYEDYGMLNDLLVRLSVHDVRVVDVPMPAIYGDESSGIDYATFVPALSVLLLRRFYWRLWRQHVVREFHPLVGLHVLGTGAVVAGVGRIARTVARRVASGDGDEGSENGRRPGASRSATGGDCGLVLATLGAALVVLGLVFDRIDAEQSNATSDVNVHLSANEADERTESAD